MNEERRRDRQKRLYNCDDQAVIGAAKGNQYELLDYLLSNQESFFWDCFDLDTPMYEAAKRGYEDIVYRIESASVVDDRNPYDRYCYSFENWNYALEAAAEGGHMDLVEHFIEEGADDWLCGLRGAVKGGQQEMIDFFTAKGANLEDVDKDE